MLSIPILIPAALLLLGFWQTSQDTPSVSGAAKPEVTKSAEQQTAALSLPTRESSTVSEAEAEALVLARAGRLDEALALLERSRELAPKDAELAYDLGTLALNGSRYDIALPALESARSLAPADARVLYALARVRLAQQHMPESEQLFRLYLGKCPGDATAHFGLGHLLAMLLRNDEARVEFDRSIRLAPNQTESYVELAELDALAGRYDLAIPTYMRVLSRAPEHGRALAGLGTALYRQRSYAEAEPILRHAVKLQPKSAAVHYYFGLTLARLGKGEESRAELAAASILQTQENRPAPH